MNCQDSAAVIVEAARDRLIDKPELEEMLAHTSTCRDCAARLADQRTLSAGLGRLAALTQNEKAPAASETRLRAAYRERILVPAEPASPLVSPNRRWTQWALATAAAAAILAVLALTSWRAPSTGPNKQQPGGDENLVAQPTEFGPPSSVKTPDPAPKSYPTPVSKQPDHGRNPGSYRAEHRRQLRLGDQSTKGTREIATDFMPMNGSDLFPIDSASVVRVELPRSALESFGFPMNMERAGERIKADVVVGNDGQARAIRFVR